MIRGRLIPIAQTWKLQLSATSLAVDFREGEPLAVRADVQYLSAAGRPLLEGRLAIIFPEPSFVTIQAAIGRRESWSPEDYDTSSLWPNSTTFEDLYSEWEATGSCPDCGVYIVENSVEVMKHEFLREVHEYLVAGDDWSLTVNSPRFEWKLLNHIQTGDSNDSI